MTADANAQAAQCRFGRDKDIQAVVGLYTARSHAVNGAVFIDKRSADSYILHKGISQNFGAFSLAVAIALNPGAVFQIVFAVLKVFYIQQAQG